MSEGIEASVESPCNGVCTMDKVTGYCQGCFRTMDEINGWWGMEPSEQRQLLTELEKRQNQASA